MDKLVVRIKFSAESAESLIHIIIEHCEQKEVSILYDSQLTDDNSMKLKNIRSQKISISLYCSCRAMRFFNGYLNNNIEDTVDRYGCCFFLSLILNQTKIFHTCQAQDFGFFIWNLVVLRARFAQQMIEATFLTGVTTHTFLDVATQTVYARTEDEMYVGKLNLTAIRIKEGRV